MAETKEETKVLDEFELDLEEKLKLLHSCHDEKKVDSCMKCEKILGCELRNEYVKAVYMSMNKGVTGGFEF